MSLLCSHWFKKSPVTIPSQRFLHPQPITCHHYMLKLPSKRCIVSSSGVKLSNSSFQRTTEVKYAKEGLKKELIPKHVALILDGNRRWLKAQRKALDYRPFFQVNSLVIDLCLQWGVEIATTFVYGYDNLQRGQVANNLIFGQLENFLSDNLDNFLRKNVKILIIGEREELPKSLQDTIKKVEEATRRAQKVQLVFRLAVCYNGIRDILQATRSLCEKAKVGLIEPNDIDNATFDRELLSGGVAPPELLIRTGGELRLSNYLLWHFARTEFYFLPIYAPEVHFLDALRSFQQRKRRGGK